MSCQCGDPSKPGVHWEEEDGICCAGFECDCIDCKTWKKPAEPYIEEHYCDICGEELFWSVDELAWVCPNAFDHGYGN